MTLLMKLASIMLIVSFAMAISGNQRRRSESAAGDPELARKIRRFAPTVLTADTSRLSANDRKALNKTLRDHGSTRPWDSAAVQLSN